MSTFDEIKNRREEILAIAKKHGIKDVRVFGSVARGDDTPESDVDFLINIDSNKSLFDLMHFKDNMEKMTKRKCDVLTESGLHWFIKNDIINEAKHI